MTDRFPSNITIEIDRTRLRRYLRTKYFLSWTCFLGLMGVMFGLMVGGEMLEDAENPTNLDATIMLAKGIGAGLAIGLLLGTALYFVLSHRLAGQDLQSFEPVG